MWLHFTHTHTRYYRTNISGKKKQIQPLPIKIISRYYIIPVEDNK